MDRPHFTYLSISGWGFGLLPFVSDHEQHSCEHTHASFCKAGAFIYLSLHTEEQTFWII